MNEHFKGVNVLITGADGFIGSHLTKELLNQGANVTAIVHSSNIKNLNSIKDKINLIHKDITKDEIIDEIEKASPDYIFHLASIDKLNNNTKEMLETNILGTIKVAESAVRIKNLKKLVFSSTFLIYHNSIEPLKEDATLNPLSEYAMSKYFCEEILKKYSSKYKIPTIITRLFNVYGENKLNNVIFFFIKSSLRNNEIYIDGDGSQLKDFIYIDDAVKALLLIAQNNIKDGIINIGSGGYIKIKELAEKIKNLTNSQSELIYRNFDPGLKDSYCDNTLLKSYGWQQRTSLEEGLKKTIKWIKENENIV